MVKAPRMISVTGHAADGTPRDPGGTGILYRDPNKQNLHIARRKNRDRRLAMAAKNDSAAKAADSDATPIVSERFIEAENEKTISIAKADPLTSSHFKDSKEPRFGVTVDEGPVVTVSEEAAAGIKARRDAEKKEAELFKVYPDRD
jgi:hypothetical protein